MGPTPITYLFHKYFVQGLMKLDILIKIMHKMQQTPIAERTPPSL